MNRDKPTFTQFCIPSATSLTDFSRGTPRSNDYLSLDALTNLRNPLPSLNQQAESTTKPTKPPAARKPRKTPQSRQQANTATDRAVHAAVAAAAAASASKAAAAASSTDPASATTDDGKPKPCRCEQAGSERDRIECLAQSFVGWLSRRRVPIPMEKITQMQKSASSRSELNFLPLLVSSDLLVRKGTSERPTRDLHEAALLKTFVDIYRRTHPGYSGGPSLAQITKAVEFLKSL